MYQDPIRTPLEANVQLLSLQELEEIFRRFQVHNPKPRGELYFKSPYTLLVAVMLSARSTDKAVNKVTKNLFEIADTPTLMLQLGVDKLVEHIKSIGCYNVKARNIIASSKIVLEQFNNKLPDSLHILQSLPGIGIKSARVILNFIFNVPTIAVDTHVFRVSNRLGICYAKTPEQADRILNQRIPQEWCYSAHCWLILHGRYICKARKPMCSECILKDLCLFLKRASPP